MLQRTEGIVLKTFPYGEADLLVTFLTADFGIRKVFAKSPRKTRSRFGSSLEPFTHAKIGFTGREDASLPRLTQADIIQPFQGLREALGCFLLASGMAELTLNFLQEGVKSEKAFRLLMRALQMMERDCSALYPLFYKIRFLALKGYLPGLDGCARCGGETRTFYVSQGSVMCPSCSARAGSGQDDGGITLSAGSVRLHKTLRTWELEKAGRIKAPEAIVAELTGVLNAHSEYVLSKPLKTRSFDAGVPASS
jgi:DNA repair protein RecO (recombination protein O)